MKGILPNLFPHLKIIRTHIEGEGKTAQTKDEEFVLVGYEYEDGRNHPITPAGKLSLIGPFIYALLNTADKSYLDLKTGVMHRSYKDFIAPLWAEYDARKEPPVSDAEYRPVISNRGDANAIGNPPKAWK